MPSRHPGDPIGGDDLPPLPYTVVQHELAQLGQISRAQMQPTGRARIAIREGCPLPFLNPERLEKGVLGESLERLSRDLPQDEAKKPNAAAIVIPRSPRRRFDRTFQHETIYPGRMMFSGLLDEIARSGQSRPEVIDNR